MEYYTLFKTIYKIIITIYQDAAEEPLVKAGLLVILQMLHDEMVKIDDEFEGLIDE